MWYKNKILITFFILIINYAPINFGQQPANTIGDVAINLVEPAMIVFYLVKMTYLIIGFSMLTASFVKFYEHRINPLSVTLGHVFFLLMAGLSILILPYLIGINHEEIIQGFTH